MYVDELLQKMKQSQIACNQPLSVMALISISTTTAKTIFLIVFFIFPHFYESFETDMPKSDVDQLEFALNDRYLKAEFFLYSALGRGLDSIDPTLSGGGPQPVGVRMARLSPIGKDIATQFGLQEVGHIRAIKSVVPGFSRPLMNLSASLIATFVDNAFGRHIRPPFDPYANDINFLFVAYSFSYDSLTQYVGANPILQSSTAKRLLAGLLGVEAGHAGVTSSFLYQHRFDKVFPYGIPVFEFGNRISNLRNILGNAGRVKDEGPIVNPSQGAEGRIAGNVIVGDEFSLSYGRSPEEILRIVYGSGNESRPGAFFPNGAAGEIAKSFIHDFIQ